MPDWDDILIDVAILIALATVTFVACVVVVGWP